MAESEDNQNIEFIALKRQVPGKFSERMMASFTELMNNDPKLELLNLELADDPFEEKLDVEFRVTQDSPRSVSGGPNLFFTFTSELTPDENLKEFRDFVANHSETAGTAPVTGSGGMLATHKS